MIIRTSMMHIALWLEGAWLEAFSHRQSLSVRSSDLGRGNLEGLPLSKPGLGHVASKA